MDRNNVENMCGITTEFVQCYISKSYYYTHLNFDVLGVWETVLVFGISHPKDIKICVFVVMTGCMIVYGTQVLYDWTLFIWGFNSISLKILYQVWYTTITFKTVCSRRKQCCSKRNKALRENNENRENKSLELII